MSDDTQYTFVGFNKDKTVDVCYGELQAEGDFSTMEQVFDEHVNNTPELDYGMIFKGRPVFTTHPN